MYFKSHFLSLCIRRNTYYANKRRYILEVRERFENLKDWIFEWLKEWQALKNRFLHPFQIISSPISTPPVQKVISVQVERSRKTLQVHFKTPKAPVTKLSFPKPNQITVHSVPSAPVQQVSLMKIDSPLKVTETPISTVPVQQVTSLRITSPMKVTSSPISSFPKPTSEFSFFWDPEAEDTKEVGTDNTSEVEKFTPSIPNQVIVSKVPSAPVQNVSLVLRNTPSSVTKTSVAKPPMDLIFCSFTPENIITSLLNMTSPTPLLHLKRNHLFPIHKTKVIF